MGNFPNFPYRLLTDLALTGNTMCNLLASVVFVVSSECSRLFSASIFDLARRIDSQMDVIIIDQGISNYLVTLIVNPTMKALFPTQRSCPLFPVSSRSFELSSANDPRPSIVGC